MARPLSAATAELIRTLLEPPSLFERLKTSINSHVDLISAIAAAKEPAAIPYLVLYLLNAEGASQQYAATAVESLLAKVSGVDLLRLDQSFRSYYNYHDSLRNWTEIKPSSLNKLDRSSISNLSVLGILSFHPSGYVREAAIGRLAAITTGNELPYLLIRLNDWVPAVRVVARKAVQARMQPGYARYFAENIYLIDRLNNWGRIDHTQFLKWIVEYLRTPSWYEDVKAELQSSDAKSRRLIYRLLANPSNDHIVSLLQQALLDSDPTVRLWTLREARKHLAGDTLKTILDVAIDDRSSAVRTVAAHAYVEQSNIDIAHLLWRLALDPAASLRAIGRYYLAKSGNCDFADFYRTKLGERKTKKQLAAAISGLGEVGNGDDTERLAPFIRHKSSKIAAAAVRALARVAPERFISEFMERLLNGAPSVSREAARILSFHIHLIDQDVLWIEFQNKTQGELTRKRILQVLFRTAKWDAVFYMLSTYFDQDQDIARLAQQNLSRWLQQFNRQLSQPTKAQQSRILAALENLPADSPNSIGRQLRFFIDAPKYEGLR